MLKNVLFCSQERKYVSQNLTWLDNTVELCSRSYSLGTSCAHFLLQTGFLGEAVPPKICSPLSPGSEYIIDARVETMSLAY